MFLSKLLKVSRNFFSCSFRYLVNSLKSIPSSLFWSAEDTIFWRKRRRIVKFLHMTQHVHLSPAVCPDLLTEWRQRFQLICAMRPVCHVILKQQLLCSASWWQNNRESRFLTSSELTSCVGSMTWPNYLSLSIPSIARAAVHWLISTSLDRFISDPCSVNENCLLTWDEPRW